VEKRREEKRDEELEEDKVRGKEREGWVLFAVRQSPTADTEGIAGNQQCEDKLSAVIVFSHLFTLSGCLCEKFKEHQLENNRGKFLSGVFFYMGTYRSHKRMTLPTDIHQWVFSSRLAKPRHLLNMSHDVSALSILSLIEIKPLGREIGKIHDYCLSK